MPEPICGSCHDLKEWLSFSFSCSKKRRFCDLYEITAARMLWEHQSSSIEKKQLDHINKQLATNAQSLVHLIAGVESNISVFEKIFHSNSAFIFKILFNQFNKKLFDSVPFQEKMGRFRSDGEVITVDLNVHEFEGSSPQDIGKHMDELWNILSVRSRKIDYSSIESVATFLSFMLVAVFAIHPFNDGNGRTGRYVFRFLARRLGFDIAPYQSAKTRRKWIKALRYAHKRRRSEGRLQIRHVYYVSKFYQKIMFKIDNEEYLETE